MHPTQTSSRSVRWLALTLVPIVALVAACSGGGSSSTTSGAGAPAATAAPSGSTPSPAGSPGSAPADPAGVPDRFRGAATDTYLADQNWLCRPDLATDACRDASLDATVVHADGSTAPEPFAPAADPKIDCFYVYPTINLTGGAANDEAMAADAAAEIGVTRGQFARFAEVCRPFAPLYRQMTLPGYSSPDRDTYLAKAYGDVHDAFATYLDRWNDGRPFVLIGHSQGSHHLIRLLQDEFDSDPALQGRLVSALLIGGSVQVASGSTTGGSFEHLALCTKPGELHCVVAFNSVAADTSAQDMVGWGTGRGGDEAGGGATTVNACTNPSELAGGAGPLQSYNGAGGWVTGSGATVSTPQVHFDGAFTASCVTRDGGTALQIEAVPGGQGFGDIAPLVKTVPGWGLHLNEVGLTQGTLIEILRAQIAALG